MVKSAIKLPSHATSQPDGEKRSRQKHTLMEEGDFHVATTTSFKQRLAVARHHLALPLGSLL